jgi:hypothetical protein
MRARGSHQGDGLMGSLNLRSMLSRLTAFAIYAGSAAAPAAAATAVEAPEEADCAECGLEDDTPIDRQGLDADQAAEVIGRSLAMALKEARPLAATQVASTWAVSADPLRRLAVAHALEWKFRLVGDDLILDHLVQDPEPSVQSAATRAAWARGLRTPVI